VTLVVLCLCDFLTSYQAAFGGCKHFAFPDSSTRPYGTGPNVDLFKIAHRAILLYLDFLAASRTGRHTAPANCAGGISTSSIIAQCSMPGGAQISH
jgi:hypothetical protein